MAQAGFTPISLYYSSTAGASPTAPNMVNGELALNTADGKLFYKDSGGAIKFFTSSTTSAGGANTNVQFNNAGAFDGVAAFTYTTGTSTLSVPTAIFSGTGAITTPNGTTAQRPGTPSLGMLRYNSTTNSFEGYGGAVPAWGSIGGSGGGGLAPVTTDFTATAAQTVFGIAYTVGQLEVYRNGIKLGLADYTATNGTTFTLATPAVAGDLIEAVTYTVGGVAGVSSFSAGTTGFTPSGTGTGAITLAGTLNVANGGTGVATLAANAVVLGNGTSAVQTVAPGATGNVLVSDGTTWTSAAPSGGSGMTLISTKTQVGNIIEWTQLSGYSKYFVVFSKCQLAGAAFEVGAFLGYGGATPTYITSDYNTISIRGAGIGTGAADSDGRTSQSSLRVFSYVVANAINYSGNAVITGIGSTVATMVSSMGSNGYTLASYTTSTGGDGINTINAIKFFNIGSGSISLYGLA